jgi:hypothetical protein
MVNTAVSPSYEALRSTQFFLEYQFGKYLVRILVVTNMLPTPDAPHAGRFIQQQIEAYSG